MLHLNVDLKMFGNRKYWLLTLTAIGNKKKVKFHARYWNKNKLVMEIEGRHEFSVREDGAALRQSWQT
jgi:hypothetical protein